MREKVDTWMPLYIADYLADTQHLSTLEHGAYLLLLMNYWRVKGPLPDDDVKLSRMCRLSLKQWKAIRSNVIEFFRVGDGQLISTRAQREIENALKKSEIARANALKRHNQGDADAPIPQPSGSDVATAATPAESLLTCAPPPASPSPSPLPSEDNKNLSSKGKKTRVKKSERWFEEDEPLDPDFYAVCAEYPTLDPHDEWEKFRGWHVVNSKSTGSIKLSARNWCGRAIEYQNRQKLRIVK